MLSDLCFSTSESQTDILRNGIEGDAIDKIKIHSAKIISLILKQFPKIFLDNKLWIYILPATNIPWSKVGLCSNQLVPQILFSRHFGQSLECSFKDLKSWQKKFELKNNGFEVDLQIENITSTSKNCTDKSYDNHVTITNIKMKLINELRAKGK